MAYTNGIRGVSFRVIAMITLVLVAPLSFADEISVMLFGQSCKMSGSFAGPMLERIHLMGPEQIFAPASFKDSVAKLRESLIKIEKSTGTPAALDLYKERLTKRLKAQIAYFEAQDKSRQERKGDALVAVGKKYLQEKPAKEFEASVKKLEAKKFAAPEISEQLFAFYNERIEPDPAEDFHRAIRRLGVKYACNYDDESGDSEAVDSSEE